MKIKPEFVRETNIMNNEKCLKWIMPSIKNRTVPQGIKNEQFNFRVKMAEVQLKLYE